VTAVVIREETLEVAKLVAAAKAAAEREVEARVEASPVGLWQGCTGPPANRQSV
jgi:hypothetical protein